MEDLLVELGFNSSLREVCWRKRMRWGMRETKPAYLVSRASPRPPTCQPGVLAAPAQQFGGIRAGGESCRDHTVSLMQYQSSSPPPTTTSQHKPSGIFLISELYSYILLR